MLVDTHVYRLVKLQRSLVGGERANDERLKNQRAKRKRAAEKKLAALAEVLSKEEHSNLVLGVYDDIHDQLTARSETLKKYKLKVVLKFVCPLHLLLLP